MASQPSQEDINATVIAEVNDKYGSLLIFFSWNNYGLYPKGKLTEIIEIKSNGFVIETTTTKDEKVRNEYTFTEDDNNRNKKSTLEQKIIDTLYFGVRSKKTPPQGYISYALWLFLIFGVLAHKTTAFAFLQPYFSFIGPTYLVYGLVGIAVIHFIEANFVLHQLFNEFGEFRTKSEYFDILLSWGWITFLLGIPITEQIYTLVSYAKRIPRKESKKKD